MRRQITAFVLGLVTLPGLIAVVLTFELLKHDLVASRGRRPR